MRLNNDRKEIRNQLECFLEGWETGEESKFDACVIKEPYVYLGVLYNCYTRDQLKSMLKEAGDPASFKKIQLINETSLISGDLAVQYASVIGVFADGEEHIAFGMILANKLQKTEEGWMFYEMRLELQSEDSIKNIILKEDGKLEIIPGTGNTRFIQNWSLPAQVIGCFMEPGPVYSTLPVNGELDTPWRVIDKAEETSEEEMINDIFCRYFCGLDTNTPALWDDIFADNCFYKDENLTLTNKMDIVKYLTILRQGMTRSFHGATVDSLKIDNKKAYVEASGMQPEAAVKGINGFSFLSGKYHLELENTEAGWKIASITYSEA